MTDEQILQNADQHVKELFLHGDSRYYEKNGFVAGAHSRDEEIKELNARIVKLMCERDSIKSESEYLIDKLRNSWISVGERLPEEGQDVLICNWEGRITRNAYISKGDIIYMKKHPEIYISWMLTPKPQIEKGE